MQCNCNWSRRYIVSFIGQKWPRQWNDNGMQTTLFQLKRNWHWQQPLHYIVSYRAIWAGIGDTLSTGYMNQFWGELFFVEDLLGRGTRTLEHQLSFFYPNTFIAWMFQVSLDPWEKKSKFLSKIDSYPFFMHVDAVAIRLRQWHLSGRGAEEKLNAMQLTSFWVTSF